MKVLKNTNLFKKFIVAFVVLLSFNVFCPLKAHAWLEKEDIVIAPAKILFAFEKGILVGLNNMFCSSNNHYEAKGDKILLTPENIIKGKFMLMDPNIFKQASGTSNDYYDGVVVNGDARDLDSVIKAKNNLGTVISKWYNSLVILSATGLLSVLVYVGIRIIISSASQDRAKYKNMLRDWLVAICLLFAMHFIMVAILNITSLVTSAIGKGDDLGDMTTRSIVILQGITGYGSGDEQSPYKEIGKDADPDGYVWDLEDKHKDQYTSAVQKLGIEQRVYDTGDAYAHLVILFGIIGFTFIFTVKYLKRMLTIIFLILLAPISCITYPIDKMGDGKAQAYNRWFQEFFYNVLIQPFHLLIYVVLVGSAAALTGNVLYVIMCFAIILTAEKFIKEMFGFRDNLSSPLGAFTSGAMASQILKKAREGLTDGSGSKGGKIRQTDGGGKLDVPPSSKDIALPGAAGGIAGATAGQNNNSRTGVMYDNDGNQIGTMEEQRDVRDISIAEAQQGLANAMEQNDASTLINNEETTSGLRGMWDTYAPDRLKTAAANRRQRIDDKNLRNYGTTNKRTVRLNKAKDIGGKTFKVGRTLGAAAVGAGAGAMFGKGREGALMGIAADKTVGNKASQKIKEQTNKLIRDFELGDKKKKQAEFNKNERNIALATESYKRRHDGAKPEIKQLEEELGTMYQWQDQYDIAPDQFADAYAEFEELQAEGIDDENAIKSAIASVQEAQAYSKKDFRNEAKMQEAYDELWQRYQPDIDAGSISAIDADNRIRQILDGAGRMKGVQSVALPPKDRTIDMYMKPELPDLAGDLGIRDRADVSANQISSIENLNIQLHNEGFDNSQIKQLAENIADKNRTPEEAITELTTVVQASATYVNDGTARNQAEELVRSVNGGNATKEQIDAEMRERYVLKSSFSIQNEKDVSAVRSLETKNANNAQLSRSVAKRHKEKLASGKSMSKEKQEMATQFMAAGVAPEQAQQVADNVFDMAETYVKPNPEDIKRLN